ncbi:MAG TPA: hypothetical protein VKF14_14515 [Candidatus Dormibacteraeota bacterium]|nr:hypothetical protein [Candidatus Dormibacteraeota bacterium]
MSWPRRGPHEGQPSAVALPELLVADGLETLETFHSRHSHASGCQAALLEVDPETGAVRGCTA